MYGLTLVIALIITGGIIAYAGDHIGRKVGRRRLSVFGLRPRHTSIVITIIAGVLVSATTIAVLSIVSDDVRTALFHMREIETALATTQKSLDTTVAKLRAQQKELDAKAAIAEALRKETEELKGKVDSLTRDMKIKADEYTLLTDRNEKLKAELARMAREKSEAQKALAEVRGQLDGLKKQHDSLKKDYDLTRSDLATARANLENAQSNIKQLRDQEVKLQSTIGKLRDERKKLEDEISNLETRIDVLTKAASSVYSQLQSTSEYAEDLSTKNLIFRADEIILATVIEGGRPIEDIKRDVIEFLARANQLAYLRGARIEGSETDAVYWFEDNLSNTYERIHSIKGKVVVRLVSLMNTMAGRPVYSYLQVFENKRIFQESEVIAKTTIDGRKEPNEVQDELVRLMLAVNVEALKRGIISDSEGRASQVAESELRRARAEILKEKKEVTVYAVAASDVWSAEGPVRVVFRITSGN